MGNSSSRSRNNKKSKKMSTCEVNSLPAAPLAAAKKNSKDSSDSSRSTTASIPQLEEWFAGIWLYASSSSATNTVKAGDFFSTSGNNSDIKLLGFYFSAHWCPPCRNFTPVLAKAYRDNLKKQGVEIVFVSSDRSEKDMQEYFEDMPWACTVFGAHKNHASSSKLAKLSQEVRGIPSLVFIHPVTGEIVSRDGRGLVQKDPTGKSWLGDLIVQTNSNSGSGSTSGTSNMNNAPILKMLGTDFVQGTKVLTAVSQVSQEQVSKNKITAVYFSAHWCPPCRRFTPELVQAYEELKKDKTLNDSFEIVFVSSDQTEAAFKEYFSDMPWLALPFSKRNEKDQLSEQFGVNGIPTLVVISNTNGIVLSRDTSIREFSQLVKKNCAA